MGSGRPAPPPRRPTRTHPLDRRSGVRRAPRPRSRRAPRPATPRPPRCIVAPVAKPSSTTIMVRLDTATRRTVAAIRALAPLELGSLMGDHRLPSIVGDSQRRRARRRSTPRRPRTRSRPSPAPRDRARRACARRTRRAADPSASATGAATATPPRGSPSTTASTPAIRLEHRRESSTPACGAVAESPSHHVSRPG